MHTLKEEFLNELGETKEVFKVEQKVKNASFAITRKKIQRLKDVKKKKERVIELIKNYIKFLEEQNLENINTISAVIDGSLQAFSKEKEDDIYSKIATISRLENEIEEEKEFLKNELGDLYSSLEKISVNLDTTSAKYLESAIKDTKLNELLLLGILKETTEEAILTAIENQKNAEETIGQITQNLIYQSVDTSDFNKDRVLETSKSILETAINIADAYQSMAKEILRGVTYGTKKGIEKSIKNYNQTLEFLPDEIRDIQEEKMLFEGLNIIDLNGEYMELLKKEANKSTGISKSILEEIIIDMDKSLTKLIKITVDTKENILKKIEKLKENPKVNDFKQKVISKFSEFKIENRIKKEDIEKVTNESKKLGIRAWEIAKNALDNALKNTKDSLSDNNKDDSKK